MGYYHKIFIVGLSAIVIGVMLVLATIGSRTILGFTNLFTSVSNPHILQSSVTEKQQYLDSVLIITETYSRINTIQSRLMQSISEIIDDSDIRMYSMLKNHTFSSSNNNIHTLQIEVEGDFRSQLVALKEFETQLQTLPMKSCQFQTKRKRKTKKLIGRYIFQYISPIKD